MDEKLPLTTFEQFILWEDRPAYPWSCFFRMRFSGRIDRRAVEAALRVVMPRHPLLTAKLERQGRHLFWAPDDGAMPEIRWIEAPTGGSMPAAGHQDLYREIGLKVFVVCDDNSSDVTLQFHHACCDGAGILVFANDLLIAYALERGETSRRVQLPKLDPERIKRRGEYGLTTGKFLKLLPWQIIGLIGAWEFMTRSPAPLLPHQAVPNDDPPPAEYPATITATLTAEETRALRETAKRLSVTVNDLLSRDLLRALFAWRANHGAGGKRDWLRMMVPINLRSSSDRLLSAANVVSSVFLDRRRDDCADPQALLEGIRGQLQRIKDHKLGFTFIFSLRLLRLIPGALAHNARKDKCTVSCIFTNVARPFLRCPLPRENDKLVVGNLVLEDADGVAPIRPYNCLTLAALDYSRRQSLIVHYDPRFVSNAQAKELLTMYTAQIRESIAVETESVASAKPLV